MPKRCAHCKFFKSFPGTKVQILKESRGTPLQSERLSEEEVSKVRAVRVWVRGAGRGDRQVLVFLSPPSIILSVDYWAPNLGNSSPFSKSPYKKLFSWTEIESLKKNYFR